MLGRAATRIELNRDSDLLELDCEKERRMHEQEMLNQHRQRMGP